MAALVGPILLIVLGLTLVIAMFTGTTMVPTIENAFLIILGYFFGSAMHGTTPKSPT
jgi:hypothetical protein